ncbi:MAG: tRNA lysidine(34) synthetase TilS [Elusimicrobia bacterium]|jgi:tRNA(Ile)-lysidine synthase|nr:tRNA lysidine(34) synthetase TilS [Elusimicrobiota bacterium]
MLIWEKFRKNIIDNKLVVSGDKVLLAVSGGADSMVMASLFSMLTKVLNIEVIVVNFNHNLRKESVKEAKIVQKFISSLGMECILKNLNTKEYAQKNDISVETAGRQLRYSGLEEIAKKYKCNKIATAHNMNDNAETVIMWLLRGTGTEGLTGIPMVRKIDNGLTVIRPLLPITRTLIDDYAKKTKIKFCTDKTNFKKDYTRNKIRLTLIPQLKKINPSVIEHIYNLSCIVKNETDYFRNKVNFFISKNVKFSKNKIVLNLRSFYKQDNILRYKILKEILPDKKRTVQLNNLFTWLKDKESKKYILSKNWIAKKYRQNLYFDFIN